MSWVHLSPSSKVTIESGRELSISRGRVDAGRTSGRVGEPIPFTLVVYFNRTVTEEDCDKYVLHYKGTINDSEADELDMTFSLEPGYNYFTKVINITFAKPGEYSVGGRVRLESKIT